MAKRSNSAVTRKLKEPEFENDDVLIDEMLPRIPLATQEVNETTVLVLTKDIGTLNVKGTVSGKLYTFHGAGSKVDIDNEDVEGLLNRVNPNNCCSGSVQQPYFILE